MKITLIGGSGFVGTRLIDRLQAESGDSNVITNIDLQPSKFFNEITTIGDVRNQEDMTKSLKGSDIVILLAAQHRDDVHPISLYYDTNVEGMKVTLRAMKENGVRRIVFFSSVAVYGINKNNPDENHPYDPFNHYGKSKRDAELVLLEWYKQNPDWNVNIIRPTVIFGERNRGNVYNLLRQIAGGRFLRVGNGENRKSMAYVGNVVEFVKYIMDNKTEGLNIYNYVDKPDMNMNNLIDHVGKVLNKNIPAVHFPYWLGMTGGYFFDVLSFLMHKNLAISSVRVKKFCATTEFDASKAHDSGFTPRFTLKDGLARTLEFEFVNSRPDNIIFKSE